jgi:hypothetical protein
MRRLYEAILERELASHRAPVASDPQSLSPYVEPPSIPGGVTVDEYRRARQPQTRPRLDRLLGRLGRLAAAPREKPTVRPAAGAGA